MTEMGGRDETDVGKLHQNDATSKRFWGERLTLASITSKVRTISSTTALPIKTTLTNLPMLGAKERGTKETETARWLHIK